MAECLSDGQLDEEEHLSLCELLDRLLNKGVVLHGDITVSVADIDLLYLGVRLLLSSIETARQASIVVPIGLMNADSARLHPPVDTR